MKRLNSTCGPLKLPNTACPSKQQCLLSLEVSSLLITISFLAKLQQWPFSLCGFNTVFMQNCTFPIVWTK